MKGFTLSMIETALTLTEHRIDATRIGDILAMGKELLAHPVELLDGVAETLDELGGRHRLVLITKGDLFHQESKVAASGVAELFENVEIVAEKDVATYARVITAWAGTPTAFCMVGNSVRSDIAPVLELGGAGRARAVPRHLGARARRDGGVAPAVGAGRRHPRGAGGDRGPRARMSVDWALLRHEAVTMTGRAYAPYSGVLVGACGLTDDGRLVRGCNVENASYGLTLCAECGLVSDLAASGGGAWWPWRWRATGARWPLRARRQLLYEHGGETCCSTASTDPCALASCCPPRSGPRTCGRAGR